MHHPKRHPNHGLEMDARHDRARIHHRGQSYLYLLMLDVETPPLYGLTSEEVFEKSES